MPSSDQIRAGRALLRMSQADLAQESGVSVATIKRIEASRGHLKAHGPTIAALIRALEQGGVHFIGETGVDLPAT